MQPILVGPILRFQGSNRCSDCYVRDVGELPTNLDALEQRANEARSADLAKAAAHAAAEEAETAAEAARVSPEQVVLTTTNTIPGLEIVTVIDVVTAECVFGMNVFRDFFAGMTDIFGGRSGATQSVLRDARVTCLRELRTEASRIGANAVVGVDLDYSEFSGQGKSMLFLVASGTAVRAKRHSVDMISQSDTV